MSKNSMNIEVPQGGDAFDPDTDMRELALSLGGRVIVPVANLTDRNATLSAYTTEVGTPTPTRPLFVYRGDTGTVEACTGANAWRKISGPVDLTVNKYSEVLKQFLVSSSFFAMDSVTVAAESARTVDVDFTLSFCTISAASAAAGYISVRVGGTLGPVRWRIHTGTGSSAAIWRTFACHWKVDVPQGSTLIECGFSSVEGAGFQAQYDTVGVHG